MAGGFPPPIPQAISLAYEINPGLGTQIQTAATQMWGDPEAIRTLSRSWSALATRVDNTIEDIGAEMRELDQDWEGSAAYAYKNWMRSLNDESIHVLSRHFKEISRTLDGTADEVSSMNQQFAQLCFYFIVLVGGLTESTGVGQEGISAALLAGVKFGDRLKQFQNAYAARLRPHTAALQQIAAQIDEGDIGLRVLTRPDLYNPIYSHEYADSYRWQILGDWRNWKMHD